MRLAVREAAKVIWMTQQQATIQLAGSGTVTSWDNATAAQQEAAIASVQIIEQNNGIPGGASRGSPNASFRTAGLAVGSTPVITSSVVATNQASPGVTQMILGAATLTGTTNPGDTFVVSGVTYTILGFYTAAANVCLVWVSGDVPTTIAPATAFSAYTVATAAFVQNRCIIEQLILEMLGA